MTPENVALLVEEANESGQVISVGITSTEEEDKPWEASPKKIPHTEIHGPLPKMIRATYSNLIYLEKQDVPSRLLHRLKGLAAFQNPEFYKKQRMRLSTARTARVICCAEEFPQYLALPRGCLDEIQDLLKQNEIGLSLSDERNLGRLIDVSFRGHLTPVQQVAVERLLENEIGILVAPPGMGKTVAGIYLMAARAHNTLILVHRKPLLEQWKDRLKEFLDIDPKDIGQIGGGKQKRSGIIDVAMLQSLVRKGEVKDVVREYGHVVADECQHISAFSFEQVLRKVRAKYVTGLTATPYRRDGHQPIIIMQCGPIRHTVKLKARLTDQVLEHHLICRETDFCLPFGQEDSSIQDIYAALILDEKRNQLIFEDILSVLEEGRCPIILTERKDHLEILANKLSTFARNLIILKGGMRTKKRREMMEQLAAVPKNEERVLLATGRYVGEGFDDARLDTLFLAMPISWRGTLVQYAGRLHRIHEGKKEVRIYDYVDQNVSMLMRMYEKRLKGYRSMGYRLVT